jgi:pimeloyl-ACP methyl ester carboxylesterase
MNQEVTARTVVSNSKHVPGWRSFLGWGMVCLLGAGSTVAAWAAQPAVPPAADPAAGAEKPAPKPVAKPAVQPAVPGKVKPGEKAKDEDEPPPAPEVNWLETKDGWRIHCMYYGPKPNVRKGRETVPIILLHGWQGQGGEYAFLAKGLQTYGHAVAVPDLRGHGRSVGRRKPDGDFMTIKFDDPKNYGALELKNMVNDVEAVKSFLMKKNNEGEVNISMLCVAGAEFGCALAVNWAVLDWSWPATPAFKQGQDVKALILLSPSQKNPKGYQCTQALNNPVIKTELSALIAVGQSEREPFSEAKRIHGRLETARPKVLPDDRERKLSLFFIEPETKLQGTQLLHRDLPVNRVIVAFIERRLLWRAEDFPWTERKSPLSGG